MIPAIKFALITLDMPKKEFIFKWTAVHTYAFFSCYKYIAYGMEWERRSIVLQYKLYYNTNRYRGSRNAIECLEHVVLQGPNSK